MMGTGQFFPGSPYTGGGVSGPGYGISFDPDNRLWVGNFGFASPVCAASPDGPRNNRVSLFRIDGKPLSPNRGFTAGRVSWPQGVVSDLKGDIWIANCGNSSVTVYPGGDPRKARNIPEDRLGLSKPFDIAIDGADTYDVDGGMTERAPQRDRVVGIAADVSVDPTLHATRPRASGAGSRSRSLRAAPARPAD